MFLRDVDVIAGRSQVLAREFNLSTQCVSSLFLRCLEKVDTGPTVKLVVWLKSGDTPAVIKKLGDTAEARFSFDFDGYWLASKAQRKRLALEALHRGLGLGVEFLGWPSEPFEKAYREVLDLDLTNTGLWTQTAWNHSGDLRAQVRWVFGPDGIDLLVEVSDGTSQGLSSNHLTQLPPHDVYLRNALGELSWVDDKTVCLRSRKGSGSWSVTLSGSLD